MIFLLDSDKRPDDRSQPCFIMQKYKINFINHGNVIT